MTAGWFDSHCHVQERYLETEEPFGELVPTLTRAREEGVGGMVCVGTDAGASRQAVALARAAASGELGPNAPAIWATVGLHPHEATNGADEVVALVEQLVEREEPALVAVGECGLDYHYDHSPRPAQRAVFARQIELALRLDLPLVIHARAAWDDLFDVLDHEGIPARSVLHCFTGGPEEARRCLDAGMMVSFSGIVTFKNADDVRQAALVCPADRMLIETDSPFLAPVPFRGKRNEPAYVPLVGRTLAELRGCATEELAQATAANAHRVFRIDV